MVNVTATATVTAIEVRRVFVRGGDTGCATVVTFFPSDPYLADPWKSPEHLHVQFFRGDFALLHLLSLHFWRTQLRSVSGFRISKVLATAVIAANSDGYSDRVSATMRIARSRRSAGYLFE